MKVYVGLILIALVLASACKTETRPVACTLEYAPVCGEDGQTYGNKCGADAAGVKIAKTGECEKAVQVANPASTNCVNLGGTLEMKEDANGQYAICKLNFGVECEEWALFRGECPKEPIPCTREYMPVCGSDGKSYSNKCELVNAHVKFASEGYCKL